MIKNYKLGSDPEFFVRDSKTGETSSAIGLIPGEKNNPFMVSVEGHALQTDNVMVEICVPAADNALKMHNDINFCLEIIEDMLPEDIEVCQAVSAYMDEKYLNNEQAKTFGCDPDYNAYTLFQNEKADSNSNLRTAGGHIHIGYEEPNFKKSVKLVKAMDLFLGLPSLVLDTDKERRKMYGKAGAFRVKDYGVEYRVLSNFWIWNLSSIEWMFRQTARAIDFVNYEDDLSDKEEVDIQLAINNNDLDLACKYMKKYNILTRFTNPLVLN